MGLDMYVYRVHKPFLDDRKVYDRDDLEGVILGEEDIQDPMYRQLLPYCAKVQVVNHYYNREKLAEDYGLDEARIGGWSCDKDSSTVHIYGYKDGERKSFDVPDDLIDSKYIIDREETCYVCREDEVHYWRKAYDIQDWIYEHLPEKVENTGYYILSEQFLKDFNKKFPEDRLPVEAPNDDYALVYWEWY